jgi:hypothetical protein
MFSITVIFDDTLDPQILAVTGFSLFFSTLFKLSISLQVKFQSILSWKTVQ